MNRIPPLTPSVPTKHITKSSTTRAVAGGVVVGGGSVAGIIYALRAIKPEWIPWTEEQDMAVATVISTVVIPVVSRYIKKWTAKGDAA